jgi:hypothetical protein
MTTYTDYFSRHCSVIITPRLDDSFSYMRGYSHKGFVLLYFVKAKTQTKMWWAILNVHGKPSLNHI